MIVNDSINLNEAINRISNIPSYLKPLASINEVDYYDESDKGTYGIHFKKEVIK